METEWAWQRDVMKEWRWLLIGDRQVDVEVERQKNVRERMAGRQKVSGEKRKTEEKEEWERQMDSTKITDIQIQQKWVTLEIF